MTQAFRLFLHELRRAPRTLLRASGFTFAAVAVFALGIGVSTTMWSAVHAVLLQPLPFAAPERLVALYQQSPEDPHRPVAPANFLDFRRLDHQLASLAAWSLDLHVVTGAGEPRRLDVAWASANFFDVLGTRAADGRLFHAGDEGLPAVLSRETARALGTRPGQALRVDDRTVQVVGIAPASLAYPPGADLWVLAPRDVPPLDLGDGTDITTVRDARYLGVVGRLARGASIGSAQAELAAVMHHLVEAYPDANAEARAILVPLRDDLATAARRPLLLLLGAAALVLLVGCLNVAGLLLVRAARRQRALALQAALGAGRAALVAPVLAETLLLAAAGGALAILLARWGAPRLLLALPQAELGGRAVIVSPSVLAFALLCGLLAALVATVLPALATPSAPAALLGGARTAGPSRGRARGVLVVAQVALAFVLIAGAGLLVRTLRSLAEASPGFALHDVVTVRLALPARAELGKVARRETMARAVAIASEVPGVLAVGSTNKLPLAGLGIRAGAHVDGRDYAPGEAPDICWRSVAPTYFATMRIPLLRGRAFGPQDGGDARTAMVNRRLASEIWPGADPIGKRLRTGIDGDEMLTVVGIVGDTPQEAIGTRPAPEIYRPLLASTRFGNDIASLVLRTSSGFSPAALRRELRRASPLLVVEQVQPLATLLRDTTRPQQLLAALLGLFGGAALLLAAVGLYALLAFLVAERRRELAVRLAVGARPRELAGLVMRRALAQVALGSALGLVAALATLRLLAAWLYAVEPIDPWSLGGTAAALLCAAALACWLPAARAARVEPALSLRGE